MGTCSAKLYKLSSETEVTLTLKAIDKEVIFGVDKSDLIDQNVKVNELPIGEKSFVSHSRRSA